MQLFHAGSKSSKFLLYIVILAKFFSSMVRKMLFYIACGQMTKFKEEDYEEIRKLNQLENLTVIVSVSETRISHCHKALIFYTQSENVLLKTNTYSFPNIFHSFRCPSQPRRSSMLSSDTQPRLCLTLLNRILISIMIEC